MYKPGGVHRGILQKNLVNFFYLRVITKLNILQTVILKESNPSFPLLETTLALSIHCSYESQVHL